MKPECIECGELKTGYYVKRSVCSKCFNAKVRAKAAEARKAKGLPPKGAIKANPNCLDCGAVKEGWCADKSWCRECQAKRAHERYIKRARAAGVPPKKVGRNPNCGTCGAEKENKDDHYCHACRAKMKRDRYERDKQSEDFQERQREKYNAMFERRQDARLKKNCREATHRAIASGKLIRKPCEACGIKDVEAHHDDYTKPLNVRWLCTKHHAEHHKLND